MGVRVGYMGQFTDQFAFGAAWQSKISMGEFDDYKGLFAQQGGFDIPSSFTVGASFRPTSQWLIALDFERIFYDDAPSVNNPLALIYSCVPPAFGGLNQRADCLGGDNGAGLGFRAVTVDQWREELERCGVIDRGHKNKWQAFKRIKNPLAADDWIIERDGFVRPADDSTQILPKVGG